MQQAVTTATKYVQIQGAMGDGQELHSSLFEP